MKGLVSSVTIYVTKQTKQTQNLINKPIHNIIHTDPENVKVT